MVVGVSLSFYYGDIVAPLSLFSQTCAAIQRGRSQLTCLSLRKKTFSWWKLFLAAWYLLFSVRVSPWFRDFLFSLNLIFYKTFGVRGGWWITQIFIHLLATQFSCHWLQMYRLCWQLRNELMTKNHLLMFLLKMRKSKQQKWRLTLAVRRGCGRNHR